MPRKLSPRLIETAGAHLKSQRSTQKNLAAETGTHATNVCKWLKGQRVPETEHATRTVGKLCEIVSFDLRNAFISWEDTA